MGPKGEDGKVVGMLGLFKWLLHYSPRQLVNTYPPTHTEFTYNSNNVVWCSRNQGFGIPWCSSHSDHGLQMWLCASSAWTKQSNLVYQFKKTSGCTMQISLHRDMKTFLVDFHGSSTPVTLVRKQTIQIQTWFHLAVSCSSKKVVLFINGEKVGKVDYQDETRAVGGEHRLIFGFPANTKLQDLRLYNSSSGHPEPLHIDVVKSAYNEGKGTEDEDNCDQCVGHYSFNSKGSTVTNLKQCHHHPPVVPIEFVVPDSWISGSHISRPASDINFNVAPRVVFPSCAVSIHTYFSVVVPAELSGKRICMDLIMSTEVLHESEWEIAYAFEGCGKTSELGSVATLTSSCQLYTTTAKLDTSIEVPTIPAEYLLLQGRLTRKPSDCAVVLHGIQFYN